MNNKVKQKATIWKAGKDCSIYAVAQLRKELAELIAQKNNITLDLSAIDTFDVSFIQLLLSAQVEANKQDVELTVDGAGEQLQAQISGIYCDCAISGIAQSSNEDTELKEEAADVT